MKKILITMLLLVLVLVPIRAEAKIKNNSIVSKKITTSSIQIKVKKNGNRGTVFTLKRGSKVISTKKTRNTTVKFSGLQSGTRYTITYKSYLVKNGKTSYSSTKSFSFTTKKKVVQKEAYSYKKYIGTVKISSVGLSQKVYERTIDNLDYAQKITDDANSAYSHLGDGVRMICDHKNQGFNKLYNVLRGDIVTFNRSNGAVEKYKVVKVDRNGYTFSSKYSQVYLSDGTNIWFVDYDLVMYTCNPKVNSRTIICGMRVN